MFGKKRIATSWVKLEQDQRSASVHLFGNLNRTVDRELRELFKDLIKRYSNKTVIVDLSQIYFIDTTIAATFAEVARRAQRRNVRLLLVDASMPVRKVFSALGIEGLLAS